MTTLATQTGNPTLSELVRYAEKLGMNEQLKRLKAYRVRVGHWEVHVKAGDRGDAIQLARQQLARELPRLYDVIRSLTAARFQVEAAA